MHSSSYSSTCHERTPSGPGKSVVHCRWPLIRGMDGHVEMCWDIDNVAVHIRWPLTTGVAQGRYYCIHNYSYSPIMYFYVTFFKCSFCFLSQSVMHSKALYHTQRDIDLTFGINARPNKWLIDTFISGIAPLS